MSVAGRRGSVRQDAAGRWSFIVDVATPGGPRRQVRRRGFPTKKTAQAALTDTLGKLGEGSYVEPSKLTVRDYVETRWLPVVQEELRASTYQSYSRNLRVHVLPRIGALRLQALDPAPCKLSTGSCSKPAGPITNAAAGWRRAPCTTFTPSSAAR